MERDWIWGFKMVAGFRFGKYLRLLGRDFMFLKCFIAMSPECEYSPTSDMEGYEAKQLLVDTRCSRAPRFTAPGTWRAWGRKARNAS